MQALGNTVNLGNWVQIGNAVKIGPFGNLYLAVNLLKAATVNATGRAVIGYKSDALISDGQTMLKVPPGMGAYPGLRLATTVADGAVRGQELITDNVWSESETVPNSEILSSGTHPNGTIQFTSDGAYVAIDKLILSIGKTYELIVTTISYTGPDILGMQGNGGAVVSDGVGIKTITFIADNTHLNIKRVNGIGLDITIGDSLSLRQILPTWKDTDASGAPLTYSGQSIADAATNKCQVMKANPTVTTNFATNIPTIVPDAVALASTGRDNLCTLGDVYEYDNSAGGSDAYVEIVGPVANLNPHSFSIHARRTESTGNTCTVAITSGGPAAVIDVTGDYSEYKIEGFTPTATTQRLYVKIGVGSIVRFILPGLYESATVPSSAPIIGDDTAAATTSDADEVTVPTVGLPISSQQGAIEMVLTPDETGQIGTALDIATGALDVWRVRLTGSSTTFIKFAAGSFIGTASSTYTHTKGTKLRIQAYYTPTAYYIRAADEDADITTVSFSAFSNATTILLGDTANIGSRFDYSEHLKALYEDPQFWRSAKEAGWV